MSRMAKTVHVIRYRLSSIFTRLSSVCGPQTVIPVSMVLINGLLKTFL